MTWNLTKLFCTTFKFHLFVLSSISVPSTLLIIEIFDNLKGILVSLGKAEIDYERVGTMTSLSTLCYIEKDGKYLMLHRVKKKNDLICIL